MQVRDPSRCETDNGLCARCVGSLRATGALPELGTNIGILAATGFGQRVVQADLKAFHLAQIPDPDRVGKRGTSDIMMEVGQQPRAAKREAHQRRETSTGEKPATERRGKNTTIYPGALGDTIAKGMEQGGLHGACRHTAEQLATWTPQGEIHALDPTIVRTMAYGIARHGPTFSLNRAAARGHDPQYLAMGRTPTPAAQAMADPGASRNMHNDAELAHRIELSRKRPEMNTVHALAARDDVRTLRAMLEERKRRIDAGTYRETHDPFLRTDALGRNALFEAHSNEAIRIFIQAGCDPLERPGRNEDETAPSPESEPNALELLTVRPLKPRGEEEKQISPAALRSRALKTISTAIAGRTFQQLLRDDPLLAGGCSPAAQAKDQLGTPLTHGAGAALRTAGIRE